MKKLILAFAVLFFIQSPASGEELTLDSPETLSVPTAEAYDWRTITINRDQKKVTLKYHALDSNGIAIIPPNGRVERSWICQNIQDDPVTEDTSCVAAGDPWSCCTGSGTGNCNEEDLCWDNVFKFEIRTQDVGTMIGIGLRNLLKNQFKNDESVISSGNDGTFAD